MNRNIVITGANRGIGLALAMGYQRLNDNVFGICRSHSDELDAFVKQTLSGIDLTNPEHITTVKQQLSDTRIDILINNAGMWHDDILGAFNYEQLEKQMAVNTFAPFRVIEALLDNLSKDAKIINITSRMGSIADNTSGKRYGYRASKAALNALTKSLAIDLHPKGIAVALIHPGFVQTRMTDFSGQVSANESAKSIIERIEQVNTDNSGSFWHANGEELPW